MNRIDIISRIGDKYHIGNTEAGEFSYVKALKSVGKDIKDFQKATTGTQHKFLDLRFENDRLAILVETKNRFSKWDKVKIQGQLQDYVRFEKAYSDKKIVAILAETDSDEVWVWYGQSVIIDDDHMASNEIFIRTFAEYEDLCFGKVNDKIKVVDSIKTLNETLHADGINEKLRSQFVGTCLLALKHGLVYGGVKETIDPETGRTMSREEVLLDSTKKILLGLLTKSGSVNKAGKLAILNNKVLEDQDVTSLTYRELKEILQFIDENVVPYINDKNTAGQDLLNLFFTTFNKYVGKSDKNQAFTPDHICDFMSKAVGVSKKSRVLDPCCGSGAFLVRAMTDAMDDCDTEEEREKVKKHQILGIEYEEGAFGLSSTNMLIHGDGNSNVVQDSMFNRGKWIKDNAINVVLMNPPYNATKKCCDPDYTKTWNASTKEDPSKGWHFVEWVARHAPATCKMAVLLPMQAAIGNSGDVKPFKKKMLDNYTLDAVFSLPTDMFYPGASAVACCMIFDLSQKHSKSDRDTFFGYYKDDKFVKRKGLGRVEKTDISGNSLWVKVEELWLDLYKNRREVPGLSVMRKVTWKDEWLAEAYMEKDYSELSKKDFQTTLERYFSYLVRKGSLKENDKEWMFEYVQSLHVDNHISDERKVNIELDVRDWKYFQIGKMFDIYPTKDYKGMSWRDLDDGGTIPVVANSAMNNGIHGFCSLAPTEHGNIITFSDTTEDNTFFYQPEAFIGFAHVQGMHPVGREWTEKELLFFVTILTFANRDLFNYGRKMRRDTISNSKVKLPAQKNEDGYFIDSDKEFSDDGFVPDWEWMDNYMKSLPYSDRI